MSKCGYSMDDVTINVTAVGGDLLNVFEILFMNSINIVGERSKIIKTS